MPIDPKDLTPQGLPVGWWDAHPDNPANRPAGGGPTGGGGGNSDGSGCAGVFFLIFLAVAGIWIFGKVTGSDESDETGVQSVPSAAADAPTEAAPADRTEYCVIGSPAARMRTGPGSDYSQVARLLQGTCGIYDAGAENGYGGPVTQPGVADTGETVDWRLVTHEADTGWIIASFIQ